MSSQADARNLLDIAARLGFKYEGKDGRGHHSLQHENGQRYSIASTPSDHRGLRNAISDMERISGRKLDRPNAGRYSKAGQSSGFSIEAAKRDQERRAALLEVVRAEQVKAEARRRAATAVERSRRDVESLMRPGFGR